MFAVLLSVAMVFTMIPLSAGLAFAEENTDSEAVQDSEPVQDSEAVQDPEEVTLQPLDSTPAAKASGDEVIVGGDSSCKHDWYSYIFSKYLPYDDEFHLRLRSYCHKCDADLGKLEAHNRFSNYVNCIPLDASNHKQIRHCPDCDSDYYEIVEHDLYESASPYNSSYHRTGLECAGCGYKEYYGFEKHRWDSSDESCVRKATLFKKGIIESNCADCYQTMKKNVSWKRGSSYSASYKITYFSNIYRNSKSVTVKIANPAKGAVLKVKIGKKTYKKKITNNKKKIKVKIKKPKKYAQKFTIKLYYKGKLIGVPDSYLIDDIETFDRVLYGKKIKKGMSKKQVRYLYDWGEPRDTASSSGGYTYWYYWSSKYVIFKNGKVKYWYK